MDGYLKRDDGLLRQADRSRLELRRVIAAFLLAPLAGAIALATFDTASSGEFGGRYFREAIAIYSIGAFPIAIILGVPAFLILKKLLRATLLACAATGAIIGALPWFLIGLIPQRGYNAWTDGKPTVINGEMTAYGWIQFAEFLLIVGAAGAVGGALFWVVAAAGSDRA